MSAESKQTKAAPRLSEFLRKNQHDIVAEWSNRVRSLSPARELSYRAVIDHLPKIVERIAGIVESVAANSPASLAELPREHAVDRLQRGFNLDEIVMEYALLRAAILDLWGGRVATPIALPELRNFNAAFDEAIKQSAVRFAQAREKLLRALDRVSEAALASADLDPFLHNLLRVVLEGTEAADSCAILLRDGDYLRARAAAGLEEGVAGKYSIKIGEGFAGYVAQQKRSITLRDAKDAAIVISPVIRASGINALYGVPMMREDEVIGVAHIGSKSALEFSEEDKLLFRTVVSRATSGVIKAQAFAELARSEAAQRFLSVASHEFGKSLDFEATLIKIAHLAVPAIADWCVVDRQVEGRIRRVAAVHADTDKASMTQALAGYPASLEDKRGIGHVFRTGKTEWVADITEPDLEAVARGNEHLKTLHALGTRSYIIVPVTIQGEVNCTISLVSAESDRRYSANDVRVAEQLADRAAAALENARLYALAQHAISVREQILATVAHDLRNQLMIIGTGAALLSQAPASGSADRVQKLAERMVPTVATMRHLVDDLVDMGAIEAGKLSFNPETMAAAEILKQAYEAYSPAAHESGLSMKLEPVDGHLRVEADPKRIMQVFSNILGNALKFTPRGGRITLGADAEGEKCVKFAIADTGPGISETNLATLFEAYTTVDHRLRSGSGLGLYIAKRIVIQHGGRLWAASEPGKGSTFYFTLPRART